jgi:hypothetical protein
MAKVAEFSRYYEGRLKGQASPGSSATRYSMMQYRRFFGAR